MPRERRCHESLRNLTPADVYFGNSQTLRLDRARIKRNTIQQQAAQPRYQVGQSLRQEKRDRLLKAFGDGHPAASGNSRAARDRRRVPWCERLTLAGIQTEPGAGLPFHDPDPVLPPGDVVAEPHRQRRIIRRRVHIEKARCRQRHQDRIGRQAVAVEPRLATPREVARVAQRMGCQQVRPRREIQRRKRQGDAFEADVAGIEQPGQQLRQQKTSRVIDPVEQAQHHSSNSRDEASIPRLRTDSASTRRRNSAPSE
jgi:hypothetical protein